MHEMSIAEGVLQAVLDAAGACGARRVERVELLVGQMRLVVPEALVMAWQVIGEGTIAAGAELNIVETPMQAKCRQCDREFAPRIDNYLCPGCGQADVDIFAGDDIILKAVVCETDGGDAAESKEDINADQRSLRENAENAEKE
jgi:hydrogenase nickel incorporation protein HypA/HybF